MDQALNLIPLRPGVEVEEFERFSREVDQPLLRSLPVVLRFDAYAVERSVGASGLEFDIVELMAVESWEEWVRVRDEGTDQRLVEAGERFTRLVEPDSVVTLVLRDLDESAERG